MYERVQFVPDAAFLQKNPNYCFYVPPLLILSSNCERSD